MTNIVHESLKKMAVGTSIILAGTIVSMLFEFLSRVLIIRSTSTAEYGVFALALVLLNIAIIIATRDRIPPRPGRPGTRLQHCGLIP